MKTMTATIKWLSDGEEITAQFGVFPDWYDPFNGGDDLPNDDEIFYWLDKHEAEEFGVGFGNDEWIVTEAD